MNKYAIILWIFLLPLMLFSQKKVRVVDNKGTVTYVDSSKWFNVGNNIFNKNKNFSVGIGVDTTAILAARLVVKGGGISPLVLQDLLQGTSTDKLLTWDQATGAVRQTDASQFAWLTKGNAGTTPGTNFLGTTDNQDLVIKTNNTERIRVNATGSIGVGTTNPNFTAPTNVGAAIPTFGVDGTINATNYTTAVQTITGTWDLSKGSAAKWVLGAGANTLTLTNIKAGMYGTVVVTNTGTSTITFGGGSNKVINGGGGIVALTPLAGAVDVLSFMYDGTTFWWSVGNNYN